MALLVALAGATAAAGCGSSDDPTTAATSLSPSEYFAKAAAICRSANQSIEADAHTSLASNGPPTAQEFQQFATATVIPETQRLIDSLTALYPPRAVVETRDALIAELQSVNDRLKANPASLAGNGDPFAKASELAHKAGLDACASD